VNLSTSIDAGNPCIAITGKYQVKKRHAKDAHSRIEPWYLTVRQARFLTIGQSHYHWLTQMAELQWSEHLQLSVSSVPETSFPPRRPPYVLKPFVLNVGNALFPQEQVPNLDYTLI
jgi:hypothetical protein